MFHGEPIRLLIDRRSPFQALTFQETRITCNKHYMQIRLRVFPMNQATLREWLMLVYKIPSEPTRFRTYIWRQVKTLGCFHLQHAVWLLPNAPDLREELEKLVSKIEGFGGEASLLTTSSPDTGWEEDVISGFNAIRDEEYAEVSENGERFEEEIRRESRKEKYTFAEMEDLEADREKLGRWMAKVRKRDFFNAPGRAEAESRLAEGAKLLEEFTRKVYVREGMDLPDSTKEGSADGGE